MEDERREEHAPRMDVFAVFGRLGYDLRVPSELQRLDRNLRFIERERERREMLERSRITWIGAFLLAVLGSAATVFLNWLSSKVLPK